MMSWTGMWYGHRTKLPGSISAGTTDIRPPLELVWRAKVGRDQAKVVVSQRVVCICPDYTSLEARELESGQLLWQAENAKSEAGDLNGTSRYLLVVQDADQSDCPCRTVALDPRSGEEVRRFDYFRELRYLDDEKLFLVNRGVVPKIGHKVHAVTLDVLDEYDKAGTSNIIAWPMAASYWRRDRRLVIWDLDTRKVCEDIITDPPERPRQVGNGVLVCIMDPQGQNKTHTVIGRCVRTAEKLWESPWTCRNEIPGSAGDVLFLGEGRILRALEMASGKERWKAPMRGIPAVVPPIRTGDVCWYGDYDGVTPQLICRSMADGKELYSMTGKKRSHIFLMAAVDRYLLVQENNQLLCYAGVVPEAPSGSA